MKRCCTTGAGNRIIGINFGCKSFLKLLYLWASRQPIASQGTNDRFDVFFIYKLAAIWQGLFFKLEDSQFNFLSYNSYGTVNNFKLEDRATLVLRFSLLKT